MGRRAKWVAAGLVAATATAGSSGALAAAPRAPTPFVIRVATPTTATPDWAYPYASADVLTTANVDRFEQLMYRPLYYFGATAAVTPDEALTLAEPPVYGAGDTTVAVTIKPGRRWSDGQAVDAQGVMAWMNLLASFPGAWGDYLAPLPGGQPLGIPDIVKDVTVVGSTVTFTLRTAVNPTWFTDSELSQITPLPGSWDVYEPTHPHVAMTGPSSVTGAGGRYTAPVASAGCAGTTWVGDGNDGPTSTFTDPLGTRTVVGAASIAAAQRCVDVVYLLRSLSADTADYTTPGTNVRATFMVSDGPWELHAYDAASGAVTMVPNIAAGATGTRPTASALELVPCTPGAGCEALLAARQVDQGPLDTSVAPRVGSLGALQASNPLRTKGFEEQAVAPWATTYLPVNFASRLGADGRAGLVLNQLYVRQALQSLVDQPRLIATDLDGYGVGTDGPIPEVPQSAFGVPGPAPYPFSIAKAASLLRAHGWHVVPGAVSTCAVAASCGTGIAKGTPLTFTVDYAPSSATLGRELATVRFDAGRVGIHLTLVRMTSSQLLDLVAHHSADWDLASWDGGWQYAPDYYPSSEWTFAAASPWNVGRYADGTANQLVVGSLRATKDLAAAATYLAAQLPVVWLPTPVTLVETATSLSGVVNSPIGAITPESWRR